MKTATEFRELVKKYTNGFHPVVPFDPAKDKLLLLDFTENNKELTKEMLEDTTAFTRYINTKLQSANATYGIGGYAEHRTIYSRSDLFGPPAPLSPSERGSNPGAEGPLGEEESVVSSSGSVRLQNFPLRGDSGGPRRLHLGTDIWGKTFTKVMAPLNGIVHSFAFNNGFGNYGATIVLTHNLEGHTFHTLYGHLSLNSLKNLQEGQNVKKGDVFAEFGPPAENGQWPPHLHFQIIIDMQGLKGDYPGVCAFSEREKWLVNCPDPDLILNMNQYITS